MGMVCNIPFDFLPLPSVHFRFHDASHLISISVPITKIFSPFPFQSNYIMNGICADKIIYRRIDVREKEMQRYIILLDCTRTESTDANFGTLEKVAISILIVTCTVPIPIPILA